MGEGFLTTDRILFALIVGGISFFVGISNKILWSGLKKIFISEPLPQDLIEHDIHPSGHSEACKSCLCLDRIKHCESCNIALKKDSVGLNKDIEHIKERLDKSDHQMEQLSRSIRSIDKSLAKLVTIVEERTKK